MHKSNVKNRLAISFFGLGLGLGLGLALAAPGFAQSKPNQSVADVALLQGGNRLQTLLDGAKKEGELTIYVVQNPGR